MEALNDNDVYLSVRPSVCLSPTSTLNSQSTEGAAYSRRTISC